MTPAEAVACIDEIYEQNRRGALSALLRAPGELDLDAIERTFMELDVAYEDSRRRLVAFLSAEAADASRPTNR